MRVSVSLALLLSFAASGLALEFAYYTSLRNDTGSTIEITPDAINGRSHYSVQPGETVTFFGGFSTERFLIRTPDHTFEYKFPLTFGAQPTHYKGREKHSYVFTHGDTIYPLNSAGVIVRSATGFPLVARSR